MTGLLSGAAWEGLDGGDGAGSGGLAGGGVAGGGVAGGDGATGDGATGGGAEQEAILAAEPGLAGPGERPPMPAGAGDFVTRPDAASAVGEVAETPAGAGA